MQNQGIEFGHDDGGRMQETARNSDRPPQPCDFNNKDREAKFRFIAADFQLR